MKKEYHICINNEHLSGLLKLHKVYLGAEYTSTSEKLLEIDDSFFFIYRFQKFSEFISPFNFSEDNIEMIIMLLRSDDEEIFGLGLKYIGK